MNLLPLLELMLVLLGAAVVVTLAWRRVRVRFREELVSGDPRCGADTLEVPASRGPESVGQAASVPPSQREAHARRWLQEVHAVLPTLSNEARSTLERMQGKVGVAEARAELRVLSQLLTNVAELEQQLIDVAMLLDAPPLQRMVVDLERLSRLMCSSEGEQAAELSAGVAELRGVLARVVRSITALGGVCSELTRRLDGAVAS